ncbi:MAG: hypothetical protein JO358_20345 [Alphaproteobacteria bacterium]|nr:hypothetical protein [Alphaproteobacteria bacterium]
MRLIEILFATLSALVILLVGFAPLFPSELPERRIKHECSLFYGPIGDAAVETCLNRMGPDTIKPNQSP